MKKNLLLIIVSSLLISCNQKTEDQNLREIEMILQKRVLAAERVLLNSGNPTFFKDSYIEYRSVLLDENAGFDANRIYLKKNYKYLLDDYIKVREELAFLNSHVISVLNNQNSRNKYFHEKLLKSEIRYTRMILERFFEKTQNDKL